MILRFGTRVSSLLMKTLANDSPQLNWPRVQRVPPNLVLHAAKVDPRAMRSSYVPAGAPSRVPQAGTGGLRRRRVRPR